MRDTASTLGLNTQTDPMVNNTAGTYDSNWHLTTGRGYGGYNDDTHHSTVVGAAAQYTFTGTGIQYLSERNGDMGTVDVYLDRGPAHHPDRQPQHVGGHDRRLPHLPLTSLRQDGERRGRRTRS